MSHCEEEELSLVAVGDVGLQRDNPELAFSKACPVFKKADVLFCNLEGPLSNRGKRQKALGLYLHRSDPKMIAALKGAGFNIVSIANNVMMSYGPQALLDTTRLLDKNGIFHVGAGKSLSEARKPTVLQVKKTRIAFLAYAAYERDLVVNQHLIAADASRTCKARAGVNLLGYSPLYEPPQIDPDDLEAMQENVRRAKRLADVLVVSFHWRGLHHYTPAMHMQAYSRSAIDEGADLILGHGPHMLQGIEVYKGKVICYSLGELLFDRAICPLPFEITHAEESVILKCLISDKKIKTVSFLPSLVGGIGVVPLRDPVVLSASSGEGIKIFRLMEKLSNRLGTRLTLKSEEAIILSKRARV